MNDQKLKEVLSILISATKQTNCKWALSGSANLYVQGMPKIVRDLDLETRKEDIPLFQEALKKILFPIDLKKNMKHTVWFVLY